MLSFVPSNGSINTVTEEGKKSPDVSMPRRVYHRPCHMTFCLALHPLIPILMNILLLKSLYLILLQS